MKRTTVNPWTYPEFFDAGVMIEGHRRILFLNGQAAVSAEGQSMYPGDIRSQASLTLDNIELVLTQAGMSLANIVRMNTYVTDDDAYLEQADELITQRACTVRRSPSGRPCWNLQTRATRDSHRARGHRRGLNPVGGESRSYLST
jgi:enamine deaminase RidA (YjgF/YER057c/UK114 family)